MRSALSAAVGFIALTAIVTLPNALHASCGPHGGGGSYGMTRPMITPVVTGRMASGMGRNSNSKKQMQANVIAISPASMAMASLSAQQARSVFAIFFPQQMIRISTIDPTMMSLATRMAFDAAGMGGDYERLLNGYADFGGEGPGTLKNLLEEAMGKIQERQKNDKDFSSVISTIQSNYGGELQTHLASLEQGGSPTAG
ncbi:MAG: hypothetical protein HQL53_10500 [Magnetococcales bacterium]|nr:hypothetical protein [Magnetococcales bacterium]